MFSITKGEFDFIEQVGMDVKKGLVYFIASPIIILSGIFILPSCWEKVK